MMQLLQQETACARKLEHVLDQEYRALSQRDVDGLETIVQAKRETIAELESLGHKREALMARYRPAATTDSSNGINPFSGDSRLASLWDELTSVAQQCQQKNRINGSIVETGVRRSRHALDILRGVNAVTETYDRTGHTTGIARTNTRVQA